MKNFVAFQPSYSATAVQVEPDAVRDEAVQGTSTIAAPTPERTGPPDTSYHMKLGYIVAGAIFLAYIVLLMRRVASVRKTS